MILDIFKFLQPPSPPATTDPVLQANYLQSLNKYHYAVTMVVFGLVLAFVWSASPLGFARSNAVHESIAVALTPIRTKQAEVEGIIKKIDDVQQRDSKRLVLSLSNGVKSDIRFLLAKRCKEKDPNERERLFREIENKQYEFQDLRGFQYQLQPCGEL